jgi:hypothetical protein
MAGCLTRSWRSISRVTTPRRRGRLEPLPRCGLGVTLYQPAVPLHDRRPLFPQVLEIVGEGCTRWRHTPKGWEIDL